MTRVLVAGALANKPGNAGEAWVRLSWVLGLARLGVETWLVEQIDPSACVDRAGQPVAPGRSENLAWFDRVTSEFGIRERAALVGSEMAAVGGVSPSQIEEAAAGADLLINISGNLTADPLLGLPRSRVYVDLDPGYTQCWHAAGMLGAALTRHEHLLTVGLGVNHSTCSIPTAGLRWRRVLPPVLLDQWPAVAPADEMRFTTVGSWRGAYGRVAHDGHLYGQKAHEFRRFVAVAQPRGDKSCDARFEAALDIHPDDQSDRRLLQSGGWKLVDPHRVAGDPGSYRRYVQHSAAEFSPAQGIYVEMRSGWVSDRTAEYLASGRPAVVQDTALTDALPLGEGLMAFDDVARAQACIQQVTSDYEHHCRAARAVAEAHFDSDLVLRGVLEESVP